MPAYTLCTSRACPIRTLCRRSYTVAAPRASHADLMPECDPLGADQWLMLLPGGEARYAELKGEKA